MDVEMKGDVFAPVELEDVTVKIEESELYLKPLVSDLPNGASPRTPKHHVFDPFAPGPDHLLLAPRCARYNEETLISIARYLDCHQSPRLEGGGDKDRVASDEEIFAALYRMLLKVVLTEYAEKLLAESSKSAPDGDGTLTSASVSTGTDDGCAGALKKLGKMLVNIDRDLCKKLEF